MPKIVYLQAKDRISFIEDLVNAGLASISDSLSVTMSDGMSIHYIGQVVKNPAVYDTSVFPPVLITPATYEPKEYAEVLLVGNNAARTAQKAKFVAKENDNTMKEIKVKGKPAILPHSWFGVPNDPDD